MSLDWLKIMQIYYFINYPKVSCFDLLFFLPKNAKKANNIQKTVIFINIVVKICHIIINI